MRISDDHLVQLIEGPQARLVLAQQHDAQEVVWTGVELVRFFAAAGYFAAEFGISEDEVLAEFRKGAQARLSGPGN